MDLFARSDCDYALLRQRLVDGAAQGVYLRTSSWKYPGWLGTVYDSPGNLGRGGMVSESQLDRTCLAEYAMLGSHGITHIYNSWSDKPAIGKQMALLGSLTNPECVGPRQLLKSGRKYQQAVDGSSPYARTQEMLPGVRRCGGAAGRRGRR